MSSSSSIIPSSSPSSAGKAGLRGALGNAGLSGALTVLTGDGERWWATLYDEAAEASPTLLARPVWIGMMLTEPSRVRTSSRDDLVSARANPFSVEPAFSSP